MSVNLIPYSCRSVHAAMLKSRISYTAIWKNNLFLKTTITSFQRCFPALFTLRAFTSSSASTSNYSSDKTTHFGYQTVSEEEKVEKG